MYYIRINPVASTRLVRIVCTSDTFVAQMKQLRRVQYRDDGK